VCSYRDISCYLPPHPYVHASLLTKACVRACVRACAAQVCLPIVLGELAALPMLETLYLHYNRWEQQPPQPPDDDSNEASASSNAAAAAAAAVTSGAEGGRYRPLGWSLHYPPPPAEPLASHEYRAAVLSALPSLQQLDDRPGRTV
jgi:hypothetical protein